MMDSLVKRVICAMTMGRVGGRDGSDAHGIQMAPSRQIEKNQSEPHGSEKAASPSDEQKANEPNGMEDASSPPNEQVGKAPHGSEVTPSAQDEHVGKEPHGSEKAPSARVELVENEIHGSELAASPLDKQVEIGLTGSKVASSLPDEQDRKNPHISEEVPLPPKDQVGQQPNGSEETMLPAVENDGSGPHVSEQLPSPTVEHDGKDPDRSEKVPSASMEEDGKSPYESVKAPSPPVEQVGKEPQESESTPTPLDDQVEKEPHGSEQAPLPPDELVKKRPQDSENAPSTIDKQVEKEPHGSEQAPLSPNEQVQKEPHGSEKAPSLPDEQVEKEPHGSQKAPLPLDNQVEKEPHESVKAASPPVKQVEKEPHESVKSPSPPVEQVEKEPDGSEKVPSLPDEQDGKEPLGSEKVPPDEQVEMEIEKEPHGSEQVLSLPDEQDGKEAQGNEQTSSSPIEKEGSEPRESARSPLPPHDNDESEPHGIEPASITDDLPAGPSITSENSDNGNCNITETENEQQNTQSSDMESDEESNKPQIFLRNFAEITEQQSESEDEGTQWDTAIAIPSGIASSYQKTISELQDYSEDSTSSSKEQFVSKLNEMVTYDTSLADLNLDCDVEPASRGNKALKEVRLAAFKLNTWLSRKKGQFKNGVNESPSQSLLAIQAPVSMQTMPPIPISVNPCPRPAGPLPVRWQPAVSVSSNKAPNVNARPPPPTVSIISSVNSTYTPPTMINNSASPVRLGWQSSVQRMVSRPNAPIQSTLTFQQVKSNTTTSFSSAPRLSTATVSTSNTQQPVTTQLIFDPAMGGVLLCPTSQLSQPSPSLAQNQNNRLSNPSNVHLQNGVILRPGADRNGIEISVSSVLQNAARPTQPNIMSQRLQNPPLRRPLFPQVQYHPLALAERNARMFKPQPAVGPLPGLRPLTASQQVRYKSTVPNSAPIFSPRGNPASNPPRYPNPRVSTIPAVKHITSTKPSTPAAPGIVGAGVTAGNQKPIPGTVEEAESDLQNKTFPSLVVNVKTLLSTRPDRQAQAKARSELDSSVKGVLVNTPAQFTEWLMRRGLLRLDHFCDLHTHQTYKLGMYSDVSRQPFSGGYVWTSECCPERQMSVFSGSMFEGSKYPPGTVLKLIYHWACQTPANNVLQWVKVTSLYLKNFFTLLRAVCISWLHEMCPPLGGEMKYVEIGVITLGSSAETSRGVKNVNVEILGVFDPITKIVRMKVINSMQGQLFKDHKSATAQANEQGARAFQILWPLTHWVDKRSILLVDGIIDKALFHELGFKNVQQCSENMKSLATNTNVMNYLRNVVPKMFSSTLSVLSKSIVQQFLDELSWREMYGQTVLQCFENVLDHIGTMTKWELAPETLISRLNKVYQNPFVDWSYSKQMRRCPMNTIPLSLRSEPGIKECIQHVMKDDPKSKNNLATSNQKSLPLSQPQKTIQTYGKRKASQLLPLSQLNTAPSAPPPPKKARTGSSKRKTDPKATLNASFAVPLDTNEKFGGSKYKINIPVVGKGKAICAECQKDVTDPNHFIGRLICSKCRYITACQGAMDIHHEKSHRPGVTGTKPGMRTNPAVMLTEIMTCKCGYAEINPYKIARHLIQCEKLTAYPKSQVRNEEVLETSDSVIPPPTNPPPDPPSASVDPPAPSVASGVLPEVEPGPLSPGNLESMLGGAITTFEDMLSLDASMETSFETLSLPPILSPTSTMPQTPMPGPSFVSPSDSQPPSSNSKIVDSNSTWNPDSWELPLSGFTAKCGQQN